jgi:hypothetical protein
MNFTWLLDNASAVIFSPSPASLQLKAQYCYDRNYVPLLSPLSLSLSVRVYVHAVALRCMMTTRTDVQQLFLLERHRTVVSWHW